MITYQYEVGGQTYQNKTFNLEQLVGVRGGTFQSEAEAKAAQYPVGKAIEVLCDPARPQRSVLDRSTPQGVLWFALWDGSLRSVFRIVRRHRMDRQSISAQSLSRAPGP